MIVTFSWLIGGPRTLCIKALSSPPRYAPAHAANSEFQTRFFSKSNAGPETKRTPQRSIDASVHISPRRRYRFFPDPPLAAGFGFACAATGLYSRSCSTALCSLPVSAFGIGSLFCVFLPSSSV